MQNKTFTVQGITGTKRELANAFGLPYELVKKRTERMPIERAILLGSRKKHELHGDYPNKHPTRLRRIWSEMHSRCSNPNRKSWYRYGGRGIKVCPNWDSYSKFKEWALRNGYEDNKQIDRIDNDGNYTPNNCRWVSQKDNANNRSNNKRIVLNGECLTLSQWLSRLGLAKSCYYARICRGWPIQRALLTPSKKVCADEYVKWGC